MSFSLVIPCYKEAKNITILVDKYRKFLKNKNNELVFVNNGSTDNTDNIFKKLKKKVKILKTDTSDKLAKKILKQEHILYPKALKKVLINL